MTTKKLSASLLVLFLFVSELHASEDLRQLAANLFGQLPDSMPGSENDTPELIALGESLYFETALSANNTQSCNSCHNIRNNDGGVDHLKTSPGALGIMGTRNSPSTWNAGFQFAQFWDGRAKDLVEQAKSPLLNPAEMALKSEAEAIEKLTDAGYKDRFKKAFSSESEPLKFNNILQALAAFQRTLVTHDRFDDFLAGDLEALNQQEKQGLQTFINTGCNACHNGPLMGGELFMKMGLVNAYPNKEDKGRAQVTGSAADNFLFKVPPLRNVAKTAPYFHDGAGATLEQAVLDTGWHQLGIKFTDVQVEDISAFLRALNNKDSDERFDK
ncbi:cytochrome-c peroxidase [Alteromonadaceae bacterium M269]|nr:cytochrome-c peroxidase [Alteromonadaceae bacterium M269]